MTMMTMKDKRGMGWTLAVLVLFSFSCSMCLGTLVWQPQAIVRRMLHNVNYITKCSNVSGSPRGILFGYSGSPRGILFGYSGSPRGSPLTSPDIYFKNNKIVTDSNHIVTRDGVNNVTIEVKIMTTTDFGIYTCKEPGSSGFLIKQAVLSIMNILVPRSVYLMAIGTNATTDTGITGIPAPGITSYVVRKADENQNMKLVAQVNPISGVMEVGAGKYLIDSTTGQFSINSVQQNDGGKYWLSVVEKLGIAIKETETWKTFQIRVGNRPNITTPPFQSHDLISGIPAVLKCEFNDRRSSFSYIWVQKTKSGASNTISNASRGALSLIDTNLRIVPTLANKGDSFTCIVENQFGKSEAITTIRMVFVKPVIKAIGNLRILLGSKSIVLCEASGYPTPVVTWLKRGADGQFGNVSGQVSVGGKSVFEIAKARFIDEDRYKCIAVVAQNPDLKDEANLNITVLLAPPRFDKEASTSVRAYPVGKELTQSLFCIASGTPRPTIKFMKGGTELKGAMFRPNGKTLNATLQYIANVTGDFGKVSCVAVNTVGKATHEIDVIVVVRPVQPTGLKAVNVDSSFIELEWNVVSGATNYKVYSNDRILLVVASNCVKVKNLLKGTTYKFYVKASNIAGDSSKSLQIQATTLFYDKPGTIRFNRDGPPKIFWTTDVTLAWLKPAQVTDGPSILYEVKYCLKFDSTHPAARCKVVFTNETTITLKGLKERTVYLFTVRSKNKERTGDEFKFEAITGLNEYQPKGRTIRFEIGPRGGALVGFIVVTCLVWLAVIDVTCCFFMGRGFAKYGYERCRVCKGKERFNENADLVELRQQNDDKP